MSTFTNSVESCDAEMFRPGGSETICGIREKAFPTFYTVD